MVKTFDDIIVKAKGQKKKIAIICPYKSTEIESAIVAEREGVAESIFVGDEAKIKEAINSSGYDIKGVEIVDAEDDVIAVEEGCRIVREGRADAIMKGHLSTSTFLKGILDKERGLSRGRILSHIVALSLPSYPKLVFVTDGGMNPHPDLDTKVSIVVNAIDTVRALGIEKPKVAILAGVEAVDEKQPETLDAAVIVKMAQRGQIKGAIVEGPLAMDIAVNSESAKIKGVDSQIAGDTDIFIVPTMAAGNMMAKALIHLAGAEAGGIVVGAKAPVILLSRSDDAETKLRSMALGVVAL
ncbi:MAG: hypothetical protein B6D57_02215 [Candidatus Coatesbacteria bacterium 4484_99]|uniref:Phosphate acetyl/butaryl transferase domain-containing protein n=1 Tax=Candidatus Coatesbacteria bacterium 4484_99 TaxID=1970774 RepID=A0A1W9S1V5_9BACT|nr:MAG: hypothetical protein B6D57_02215 [Candidatus Coatesbacteria bacterium 4484_99]HEC80699.1 bifunctional enoyl-CoA hydratase/phosphate acetyltransferase [Bacillota bacterium]